MDIAQITTFLGWCTLINTSILVITALSVFFCLEFITSLQSQLYGVSTDQLPALYFSYMANYKIAIIVFNLVPYVVLKLTV